MSFTSKQFDCFALESVREKHGISPQVDTKIDINTLELVVSKKCNTMNLCSDEIRDTDSAFSSEEEQCLSAEDQQKGVQKNTIVASIQKTICKNDAYLSVFTQLSLICSDKLCVFKINPDALKKLVAGNFIEENGLTSEIHDNAEECTRKRVFSTSNFDPANSECVEMKKMKFSEFLGVIGDRSFKNFVKMATSEKKIIETETLARITWDVSKRCSNHKEPLYFVCEACDRTVCSKCIVENHQGHRIVAKNTESAYSTGKKLMVSLNNYIKDIENLLWQIEMVLNEIPRYAHETAECVTGLLNSWEYHGSCIHRKPYLLKLIDTIKTQKIKELKLQRHNLNQILFRMTFNQKTLQKSILTEDANSVTYSSLVVREDLEFSKGFDYGFVPIHNKEFRITLKAKTLKRPAALTVLSTTLVEPMKKLALQKVPFEDSERFSKIQNEKFGFRETKVDVTGFGKSWCFGKEGSGEGELCRPWGIACDKDGNFYISDRSNNRIQVFDSNGEFLFSFGKFGRSLGELNRPAGITIDVTDRVIVADKDNHRVQIFNTKGEFLLFFGELGNSPGKFNYPWDVCSNSRGEIAVSDTKNRRVQIFTKHGILNGLVDFYPYDLKFFDLPRAVQFNPRGELIVGDFNTHRFMIFDQICSSFKLYGREGEFNRPQGLFVDGDGNHVVSDSKNSRVAIYDRNFKLIKEVKCDEVKNPQGVCLTRDGNVAVVDMENHKVVVFKFV